jgi:hypothetical protein
MSQGSHSRTDGEKPLHFGYSGDPYNCRPASDLGTARRRTLDDMRKLSEQIKSARSQKLHQLASKVAG